MEDNKTEPERNAESDQPCSATARIDDIHPGETVKRLTFNTVLAAALVLLLVPADAHGAEGRDGQIRLTVDAGDHPRIDTPLSVPLDSAVHLLGEPLELVEITAAGRVPIACQIETASCPFVHFILPGRTESGAKRIFELVPDQQGNEKHVRAVRDKKTLRIVCNEKEVLAYNHAPMPPPEGKSALYRRSGFIHPLRSPAGEALTRIHPPDHVHHMGLWNPWTKARFEGRHIDFWNLGAGTGTVRFRRFASTTDGPVLGGFNALHEHVDLSAPDKEKIALYENWDVRVWNLGDSDTKGWIIDFASHMRCATASPLVIDKYRYGGFGFRAAASFDAGDYLTSEGKTRKDGHATRARWCIVHGPTAKGPAGIVFMGHPQNRDYPEPMRIWNNRPEIFFNFCPVQAAEWTLEGGAVYLLKYRLYVYDGTIAADVAERLQRDFGEPPAVTVETLVPEKK